MPIIVNDRLGSVLFLYYFPDILIIMVVTERATPCIVRTDCFVEMIL